MSISFSWLLTVNLNFFSYRYIDKLYIYKILELFESFSFVLNSKIKEYIFKEFLTKLKYIF